MAWKPSLQPGVDMRALPLSPMQGYLLSRVDGATDVHQLSQLVSLPEERIETLLRELVNLGVVASPPGAPAAAPPAVAEAEAPPPDETHDEPLEGEEAAAETLATHRALYAQKLRELPAADREAMARTAVEPELSALCFDPLPAVVNALLDNPQFGLMQARLVAAHHHGLGLDALTARASFAADAGVRRALLKNPQLNAGLFRRLWAAKRLLEQFKVAVSREVTEGTRRTARETMRQHFTTATADERVELIWKTEGRSLTMLVGLPVDSKTTSILCSKSYGSTQLVQNLARWGPAPPALIAHLLKQELVRRSPTLRTLLERHPNAPKSGHS